MGDEVQPGQGGGRQDGDPVFRNIDLCKSWGGTCGKTSPCDAPGAKVCRNIDLCKWAVWRAKPRAKRRERYPLLGMGAKRAICGPFPCQKRPKRHPLLKMGAKSAIWRAETRQKRPKRHPSPTMGAKSAIWRAETRQKWPKRHPFVAVVDISSGWAVAICTGRFSVRFHHGRPRSGATIDPRSGWARMRVERLAIGLAL